MKNYLTRTLKCFKKFIINLKQIKIKNLSLFKKVIQNLKIIKIKIDFI